jgi:hypothetical protein
MAKPIVPPAVVASVVVSMGVFFDLVDQQISEANSTDFDGIEFLVKGARAEIDRLDKAAGKAY